MDVVRLCLRGLSGISTRDADDWDFYISGHRSPVANTAMAEITVISIATQREVQGGRGVRRKLGTQEAKMRKQGIS